MTENRAESVSEDYRCVSCGVSLTDPKNAGDPDENGDWVCRDAACRAMHEPEMTVTLEEVRA